MSTRSWSLALALGFAVCGQGCTSNQETIPFQLQDNLVHLTARMNDQPLSSVLDSGTGAVILNLPAAEQLHLEDKSSVGPALGGGEGSQQLFPIVVDKMQLGPTQLKGVNGFALDLHSLSTSAGFAVDALIGDPVFEAGVVKIDYPAQRVTFQPSGRTPVCRNPIPIKIANGVPIADVALRSDAGGPAVVLHMIVDLGTRHFAAIIGGPFLNSDAGKALLRSGRPQQVGTGTGGAVSGTVARVAELEVGGRRYPNLEIALTGHVRVFEMGFADGSLGVPLWNHGTISFDYPNRIFCFD